MRVEDMDALRTTALIAVSAHIAGQVPGRKAKPTPARGRQPEMRPMPIRSESTHDRATRRARIEQAINEARERRGEWDR